MAALQSDGRAGQTREDPQVRGSVAVEEETVVAVKQVEEADTRADDELTGVLRSSVRHDG